MNSKYLIIIGQVSALISALMTFAMIGPDILLMVVISLGSYAFFLSRNWISPSLIALNFFTVIMLIASFGEFESIIIAIICLTLLYIGIIGVCMRKTKKVNIKQKIIILCWLLASLLIGIYLPWNVSQSNGTFSLQYGSYWSPPHPDVAMLDGVYINITIVFIQIFILSLIGFILFHVLADRIKRTC